MENQITRLANVEAPEQWMQVWAIKLASGSLLPPIDDDGEPCFMAFATAEAAEATMQSQIDKGYIDAEEHAMPQVVRVA